MGKIRALKKDPHTTVIATVAKRRRRADEHAHSGDTSEFLDSVVILEPKNIEGMKEIRTKRRGQETTSRDATA